MTDSENAPELVTAADADFSVDTDTRVQEVLLAASNHDLTTLQQLLREYTFPECEAADVQDPETGFSPLHAAIAACDVSEEDEDQEQQDKDADPRVSEDANGLAPQEELVEAACETVRLLLGEGAIWNQLDSNNETPGCLALRLGFKELYGLMVDAGVRAEILMNRLDSYKPLAGDDEEEEEEEEEEGAEEDGVQNGAVEVVDVSSEQYLASALTHSADKLLDDQSNGVMMAWESDIMKRSADALLSGPGLSIINIGFGMGIIDTYIQSHTNKPASHHIIEAHPSVLADMRSKGWFEKPGLTIHEGKWQDVLPELVAENQTFDAIYFDTFAEDYAAFRDFFSEQVIGLLAPAGKWSFFNGMGADRQLSYDVYQKVVEMDLMEAGYDIEWTEIEIPKLDKDWEGVKRKYWNVDKYRLPLCKFLD